MLDVPSRRPGGFHGFNETGSGYVVSFLGSTVLVWD